MKHLILILFIGCIPYNIEVVTDKPLKQDKAWLESDVTGAHYFLETCKDFSSKYPKEHQKLKEIRSVRIAQADTTNATAYVDLGTRSTILISRRYLAIWDPWFRQSIMAHELMHLIGLPDHKEDFRLEDKPSDEIYRMQSLCFPQGVRLE